MPHILGEGYGDLLELDGIEGVAIEGDYAALTRDILPLQDLAAQEQRARGAVDQYDEIKVLLLEAADSKW